MKRLGNILHRVLPVVMLATSCATHPAVKSNPAASGPDLMLNANLLCIVAKETELVSRELEFAFAEHQQSGHPPLDTRGRFATELQRLTLEISALHDRIAEEVKRLNNTLSDGPM